MSPEDLRLQNILDAAVGRVLDDRQQQAEFLHHHPEYKESTVQAATRTRAPELQREIDLTAAAARRGEGAAAPQATAIVNAWFRRHLKGKKYEDKNVQGMVFTAPFNTLSAFEVANHREAPLRASGWVLQGYCEAAKKV